MIAFGAVTTDDGEFRSHAGEALQRVIEGDSLLMRRHLPRVVGSALNEMLAEATSYGDELEAVILIDQGAAVRGEDFVVRARGLIARGVDVTATSPLAPGAAEGELPVDGALLLLSAAAGRELRFDPHSDAPVGAQIQQICAQARASSRWVVAAAASHVAFPGRENA